MLASEVFSKAADYVEEHGHCKKVAVNQYGQVCLLGAIGKSGYLSMSIVRNYISQATGVKMWFDWNDAPERTPKEVINALRLASDLARKDGN